MECVVDAVKFDEFFRVRILAYFSSSVYLTMQFPPNMQFVLVLSSFNLLLFTGQDKEEDESK